MTTTLKIERQESIEVYVGEKGDVCIRQEDYLDNEHDSVVVINTANIEAVIRGLRAAKKEALASQQPAEPTSINPGPGFDS